MIYIILVIVGAIGISATLWMSHPRLQLDQVPHGDPWYVLHPENFESGLIQYGRSVLRFWIKKILIVLIAFYRKLSEKISVRQVLKKKIRSFLYEHTHDGIRKPSEFWDKVRKTKK